MDVGVMKSLAPAEDNRDQVVSGCEMSYGLNLYIWTLTYQQPFEVLAVYTYTPVDSRCGRWIVITLRACFKKAFYCAK